MKKVLFIFIFLFLSYPIFIFAEQININTATLSQLDEIVHVGPKTAQKIIDGRLYSSVQDLSRIKGIGNGKYLQDIINQGFACINCQTTEISQTQNTDTTNQSIADTTSPTIAIAITTAPQITYPSGIYINEILPNPTGADSLNEWIELYNSNNNDVDLSGWKLRDQQGAITTYIIPSGTKILANGYLIFKRPDTSITLDNDEDGLNLLTPDGGAIDSISFMKAPLGQSYNKISGNWAWSTTLTPGAKNIITVAENNNNKTLSKPKNSAKTDVSAQGLADISQSLNSNQDNKLSNPWFLFFIVLATTIILAAITLILKLRFRKITPKI